MKKTRIPLLSGMGAPFELSLGWRFALSGARGAPGFQRLVSRASAAGIALGVALLIVSMSILDGLSCSLAEQAAGSEEFHASVRPLGSFGEGQPALARADADRIAQLAMSDPRAESASPLEPAAGAMAKHGEAMELAMLSPPKAPKAGIPLAPPLRRMEVAMSPSLSKALGLASGDAFELTVGGGGRQSRARTAMARLARSDPSLVPVAGIGAIAMRPDDMAKLLRLAGPPGIGVRLRDPMQAPEFAKELAAKLGPGFAVATWLDGREREQRGAAAQMRGLLAALGLLAWVGSLNLAASLAAGVEAKRSEIAVMAALGARPASVMAVLMARGAAAGILGSLCGAGLGWGLASHPEVLSWAAGLFGAGGEGMPRITGGPKASEVLSILGCAGLMSVAAALCASWQASRAEPGEALRHG